MGDWLTVLEIFVMIINPIIWNYSAMGNIDPFVLKKVNREYLFKLHEPQKQVVYDYG